MGGCSQKFQKKYTKSCDSLNLYFSSTLLKACIKIIIFFLASENFSKQGHPVSNPEDNIVQVVLFTFFFPREKFSVLESTFPSLSRSPAVIQFLSSFLLQKNQRKQTVKKRVGKKLSLMKKKNRRWGETWAKWSQHQPAPPGKQSCSIWGPHGGCWLWGPRLG